jgi:hypothetical protein
MTDNFSSDKPQSAKDLSHRILKKMGIIDPSLCEPNNPKEIEFQSNKKQRSEKWYVSVDSSNGSLRISKNQ